MIFKTTLCFPCAISNPCPSLLVVPAVLSVFAICKSPAIIYPSFSWKFQIPEWYNSFKMSKRNATWSYVGRGKGLLTPPLTPPCRRILPPPIPPYLRKILFCTKHVPQNDHFLPMYGQPGLWGPLNIFCSKKVTTLNGT